MCKNDIQFQVQTEEDCKKIVDAAMTLGIFGACLIFGLLCGHVRPVLPGLIHLFIAIAYLLFAFFPSVFSFAVGMVLIGIGNGLIMCYYQTHLAVAVLRSQTSFALGLSSAILGVLMFFCTYFGTFLRYVTDGSILSVCAVLFVVSLIALILAFGKECICVKHSE